MEDHMSNATKKNPKGDVRRFARVLAVLALSASLTLGPCFSRSAQAGGFPVIDIAAIANQVEELAYWAQQIEHWKSMLGLTQTMDDDIKKAADSQNAANSAYHQAQLSGETKAAQANVDSQKQNTVLNGQIAAAQTKTITSGEKSVLCVQKAHNDAKHGARSFAHAVGDYMMSNGARTYRLPVPVTSVSSISDVLVSIAHAADGDTLTAKCFAWNGGAATVDKKSGNCQDGTQSAVEGMKLACAIGVIDPNDIAGVSKVAGVQCTDELYKALKSRGLATTPQVLSLPSMFITSTVSPTKVASLDLSDPGIRERLFLAQQYMCNSLGADHPQMPVKGDIVNNQTGFMTYYHEMTKRAFSSGAKAQLCFNYMAEHVQVPCDGAMKGSFKDACTVMAAECENFRGKITDIDTRFPGCKKASGSDKGAGSLSIAEVEQMEEELCGDPESILGLGQGTTSTGTQLAKISSDCIIAATQARNTRRLVEIETLKALMPNQ
jgi:hypothetical protein